MVNGHGAEKRLARVREFIQHTCTKKRYISIRCHHDGFDVTPRPFALPLTLTASMLKDHSLDTT